VEQVEIEKKSFFKPFKSRKIIVRGFGNLENIKRTSKVVLGKKRFYEFKFEIKLDKFVTNQVVEASW
jgi:hypothetical protein